MVEKVGEVKARDVEKLRQLPKEVLHWMLAGLRGGGKRLKIREYGSLSEAKEKLRKEYLPALNRVIEAHHAWYMTKGLWREGLHRELYKGRWRIENGHWDKGFFWGKTKSSSLKVRFYFAAVSFALYNAWQLERIGTTAPAKAVEVAAQLSHTFECLSLILLKGAINTLIQILLRLLSEAVRATEDSSLIPYEQNLQTLLGEYPLYEYLLQAVVEEKTPPPTRRPEEKPPPITLEVPVERVVV
ncbi:MAG: hypothetical protein ACTSP1_16260 [Candidatus Freyarchaeota archaeon]